MSLFNWELFIAQDAPRLYRYFKARFNEQQSNDLVQEVLIRLHKKIETGAYDVKRGPVIAFAFGLAHFVAREALNKYARSREIYFEDARSFEEFQEDGECIEERYVGETQVHRLREAIKNLSTVEQDVICLMLDEDITMNEIALILNMSPNTVKSHVHRAKAKLRDELTGAASADQKEC